MTTIVVQETGEGETSPSLTEPETETQIEALEEVAETVSDSAVEVAQIEADRDITIAAINADVETARIEAVSNEERTQWETRLASMEAENRELRDRLSAAEATLQTEELQETLTAQAIGEMVETATETLQEPSSIPSNTVEEKTETEPGGESGVVKVELPPLLEVNRKPVMRLI